MNYRKIAEQGLSVPRRRWTLSAEGKQVREVQTVSGLAVLEVDVQRLLDLLGPRAADNKSRSAIIAGGAIRVRIPAAHETEWREIE